MSNSLIVKQPERTNCSSDINQIDNKFNQVYLKDNNTQNIVGEIQKKNQNQYNLINWCLENQSNFMIQIILANCYRLGKWTEKDEHKAFIYYQKSAEMNDASGICGTGYCYYKGIGVEKDEHKAFIYYRKSSEMGDATGTFNVGYCYENGIGIEMNEHKAFLYYQKSSEMSYTNGTFNVGYCYENGIGVKKDEYKAFIYYQKSSEMGSINGTSRVGYFYKNGIGVEKDVYKAFIYYRKSAEMGDTYGTYMVGYCYHYGVGIQKDDEKAFIYYKKYDIEKDEYEAFIHYQKSVEIGIANAIFAFGNCHKDGIYVENIIKKSVKMRDANGKMRNTYKTISFGYYYLEGKGVEKVKSKQLNLLKKINGNGLHETIEKFDSR
ncbi:hypothetical protein C2G38_2199633 [Gigaspora rosea]|uniref:Sel1 repeat protein n=1 Tax=Gigaspora rosea TaxID=44941 RepID=A0A397UUF8_9GLOM|nr:hypothetical protein C2G38_2199633 [Gigaspora rosea]